MLLKALGRPLVDAAMVSLARSVQPSERDEAVGAPTTVRAHVRTHHQLPVTAQRLVGDLAIVPDDNGRPSLSTGAAIDIDDRGRISGVGSEADLGDPVGPVRRVGGLLMPGLVNAHAHTPMTLLRSAGDGLPLQRWLEAGVWPRELQMTGDDAYWGMVLGSSEMLLAGVTTSCEMYLHEAAVARAVADTGGRLVITPGIIAALAPDGRLDGRLDEIVDFHRSHHDPDQNVSVGFGPHSLYDLAPEQVGDIVAAARPLDAVVHIHLDETEAERTVVMERHGHSATSILAQHGALEGRLLGAHGVWLDDADIVTLGAAGAAIAHCPLSNLKLGSGIARLPALLAGGVTVGLGTDGPASNDNLDLWEEMKVAPLLARGSGRDPGLIDRATAIELATINSARAIGLEDVGVLDVGFRADIVRVDLDHPAFAPAIPADLLTTLAFAGSSKHVTDVWVSGRQLVTDGSMLDVDVHEAQAQVSARGARLVAG